MKTHIQYAKNTGGKAGKGYNKTSTVQVIDLKTHCIIKHFRFKANDIDSKNRALRKAQIFSGRIKE